QAVRRKRRGTMVAEESAAQRRPAGILALRFQRHSRQAQPLRHLAHTRRAAIKDGWGASSTQLRRCPLACIAIAPWKSPQNYTSSVLKAPTMSNRPLAVSDH